MTPLLLSSASDSPLAVTELPIQLFTYAEYDLQDILAWHYGTGFGQPPTPLPEFTLRSLAWQLLNGIEYLHKR